MTKKRKSGQRTKGTVKPKHKSKTIKSNTANVSKPKKQRIRKTISLVKTVFAVLGIWGVVLTTWVVFNPRVFVRSSGVALDPNNPAFTPFVVQNMGYLSIHNVTIRCSVKYLKLPGDIHVIGLGDYTNRFSDPKQVASVIDPKEEYTILLPLTGLENNQIENADIAIVLSFRPKWLWQRETLHRFVAAQSKNGQWYWFQQPINE